MLLVRFPAARSLFDGGDDGDDVGDDGDGDDDDMLCELDHVTALTSVLA